MTTNHTNCSHPTTKAARAMCRRDTRRQDNLAALVDQMFAEVLEANCQDPYSPAAYDEAEDRFKAAVLLYADTDLEYARALERAFFDSNEDMHWYTTQWTRDSLVYHFRTFNPENGATKAIERRLGMWDDED